MLPARYDFLNMTGMYYIHVICYPHIELIIFLHGNLQGANFLLLYIYDITLGLTLVIYCVTL